MIKFSQEWTLLQVTAAEEDEELFRRLLDDAEAREETRELAGLPPPKAPRSIYEAYPAGFRAFNLEGVRKVIAGIWMNRVYFYDFTTGGGGWFDPDDADVSRAIPEMVAERFQDGRYEEDRSNSISQALKVTVEELREHHSDEDIFPIYERSPMSPEEHAAARADFQPDELIYATRHATRGGTVVHITPRDLFRMFMIYDYNFRCQAIEESVLEPVGPGQWKEPVGGVVEGLGIEHDNILLNELYTHEVIEGMGPGGTEYEGNPAFYPQQLVYAVRRSTDAETPSDFRWIVVPQSFFREFGSSWGRPVLDCPALRESRFRQAGSGVYLFPGTLAEGRRAMSQIGVRPDANFQAYIDSSNPRTELPSFGSSISSASSLSFNSGGTR